MTATQPRGVTSLKTYFIELFKLTAPFWTSEKKRQAWALLILTVGLEFFTVSVGAYLSYIYADAFDGLTNRNMPAFYSAGAKYLAVLAGMLTVVVLQIHVQKVLIIIWRWWLTQNLLGKYFAERTYNQIELKDYGVDNPDQRISMDVASLCEDTLTIGLNFLSNFARVFAFGAVLWTVSGSLEFALFDIDVVIPGYMLWIAIIYAIVMTWGMHLLIKPMTQLQFERQGVEADFRYQLIRTRENAESIALIGGEKRELKVLDIFFDAIHGNWMRLLKYQRRMTAYQAGLSQLSLFFPILAGLPGYLAGAVTFGGLMQLSQAFTTVASSLQWFATSYGLLAEWKAKVDRVLTFNDALDDVAVDQRASEFFYKTLQEPNSINVADLTIKLPDGRALYEGADLKIEKGKNVLVSGPSGAGKSTLFRALSGLWVWGRGEVSLPPGATLFVPQKPYLPTGSLRAAVCYPADPSRYGDDKIIEAMRHCQLGDFTLRLDETDNWSRVLSGGEQQRVGLARIFLERPDWLFLDESTSALDAKSEAAIFKAFKEHLPETTIISISHHTQQTDLFDKTLKLDPKEKSFSIVNESAS